MTRDDDDRDLARFRREFGQSGGAGGVGGDAGGVGGGAGGAGDGEDPDGSPAPDLVADFFAAERAQVRDLPADELRWQRITHTHRSRGRSWLRYGAAAAAAVVVLGGGVGLLNTLRQGSATPAAQQQPTVTTTVTVPGPTASSLPVPAPTATSATSATDPSASVTGASALPTRVPDDFAVLSVTTVASGRLFALGPATCAGQPCTLVATSGDSGSTWSVRGQVPGVDATPRLSTSSSAAVVGSGTGVTDVRFASDTVGWVFGRTVLRTTDGGRSWAPYAQGGSGPVLALETNGRDVVLAAAGSCAAGGCTGAVTVSRAPVAAASASRVGAPLSLGTSYLGLDIAWRQQTAVVSVRAGTDDPPATAVTGSSVTTLTRPDCAGSTGPTTLAAPADGSGLVLVCGPAPSAPKAGAPLGPVYAGDGRTWTRASDAGPQLAAGSLISAAAVDPDHLLLAVGGSAGGSTTTREKGVLSVSSDAGRTWREPSGDSPPKGGFAWVGSPGGRTYYALPAQASPVYWRSTDAGETWRTVGVR